MQKKKFVNTVSAKASAPFLFLLTFMQIRARVRTQYPQLNCIHRSTVI